MTQTKCPITRSCQSALRAFQCLEPALRGAYHPITLIFMTVFLLVSYWFLDKPTAEYFHHAHASFAWMNAYEVLGQMKPYLVIFGLLTVYAAYAKPARQFPPFNYVFIWLCTAYLSCSILKVLLGRARPVLWFQNHWFGFFGPHFKQLALFASCPSGHTTTLIALALGFGLCCPKHVRLFLLIGFFGALTRVMLTYHYLSDVVGTTYFTILLFLLVFGLLRRCFSTESAS